MAAIFKLYSRSWFFLRWHRLIYALPVLYFLINSVSLGMQQPNLTTLNFPISILNLALKIGLELFLIITIFQYKDLLDADISTWSLIKRYFLRVCGIKIAGVVLALALLSPFCFFVFLVMLAELNNLLGPMIIVGIIGFIICYFGVSDLGIRILISKDKKVKESMWQGIKELSSHLWFYQPFVLASIFLSALPFLLTAVFSGIHLTPFLSLDNLLKLTDAVGRSVWSILMVFNYIIVPLHIAAKTFIYLDRNSNPVISLPLIENLDASTAG